MLEDTKTDDTEASTLGIILDDDLASAAFAMLVFGVILLPILVVAWPSHALRSITIISPLLILIPLTAMAWRVRRLLKVLANGLEVRARVLRKDIMAGTPNNPPMLAVTLSYRFLDVPYEARVSDGLPSSLGTWKEGDEVALMVDTNKPSRYVLHKGRFLKQGSSRVVRPPTGERVKACIARCEQIDRPKLGCYAVDVTFTLQGKEYRCTRAVYRRGSLSPPYKSGDEVVLIVNPNAPEHFYFPDNPL